jgi:outer membrane protein assembly factor BamB
MYVGSYDTSVYALNAATGAEIWQFPTEGWVVASPLVHDGVVYVGSNDGRFYAIDAVSGKEIGHVVADGIVESFPAVLGGQVLFGSGGGSVYAIAVVSPGQERVTPPGTPATPIGSVPLATPLATPR